MTTLPEEAVGAVGLFDTLEAAKAAAQADYEVRIKSALEPSANTCPCTKIQQDETCPVGYPSLLCEICDGKGVVQPSAARELALVDALEVAKMELQAWIKCADENGLCVTSTPHVIEHIDIALASLSFPDHAHAGKVEGDGWMPIESAPKDGTLILAWNYNSGMQVVGWQPAYGSHPFDEDHWDDVGSKNAAPSIFVNARHFTHWRPLPSAPASEGAE